MTQRTGFLVVALGGLPLMARAQVPAGPEFRVNTYTTGLQFDAFVASRPGGDFVVVWNSFGQDGHFGQLFSAAGTPTGAEFRVNTFTTDQVTRPSVAWGPSGEFVVAWTSEGALPGSKVVKTETRSLADNGKEITVRTA